jgi:hypothetical protein
MIRHPSILLIGLLLAACAPAVDPCTADPTLSVCKANQAVARSTIAAADADTDARVRQSYMKATQDAIALHAQATQGAINSLATSISVEQAATRGAAAANAQATRQVVELDALRNSISMSATQSALLLDTTRQSLSAEATTTALIGDTRINAAVVQANTAATGQIAIFASALTVLVALAAFLVWYSRRVAAAFANAADVKLSLVRYGHNNERIAYPYRRAGGEIEWIPVDQILGHSSRYLPGLNVPDLLKLAAAAESDKRTKSVAIAQATGAWPMLSAGDEPAADQLAAPVQAAGQGGGIPTFAELLRNWQPTPDRLLFGYGNSGPLYGRLDQLLSVEIIGRQGQGKTTLLRLIYAQCLMVGVQMLVWDLHEDIVEDLPGAQTFTSADAIEQSAIALQAELDRRIAEHDKVGVPIMALIDEINNLVNVVPVVAQVIGRVVNEGRKYRVFCIISAKGIPAALFNGSTVRDSFSSRYAFNTTTRQAAMIGFDREAVPAVRDLTPGRALFDGPFPTQIISVPNTTAADVKSILAIAAPVHSPVSAIAAIAPATAVDKSGNGPAMDTATAGAMDPAMVARREQVRDLIRAETPVTQIIKQVWGVSTGHAFTKANLEYRQIAATLMSGG